MIFNGKGHVNNTPPIPAPNSKPAPRLLECSYCHGKFELTWKLNLPLLFSSKFRCPCCKNKTLFKVPLRLLILSWIIMFVLTFSVMALVMISLKIIFHWSDNILIFWASVLFGLLCLTFISRFCNARFGVLTKSK
jgi:hypothetical protein